ncbi:MAG TPA: DUF420 domain-containing protein [Tepidisphaeraceae bacterium]|nr:DUF420 domain-containing protein [Tepidisphaeraceae bacterium]
MTAETLPKINAILNGISFILLVTGFVLIKRKKMREHGIVMLTALGTSSLFLIGYLSHKAMYGDRRLGEYYPNLPNAWKYFYWFVILIPHLILAIVMLPFIIRGVWFAYKRDWKRHRATNRYTIWMWLYVSVTGVIVYLLLYQYFPILNERYAGV